MVSVAASTEAQRASMRSASMRTLREWAANPKRRRCSAWKWRRSCASGAGCSDSDTSLSPGAQLQQQRAAHAAAAAVGGQLFAHLQLQPGKGGVRGRQVRRTSSAWRRLARRTARRSATPTPNADSRLASGCTRICRVPAARATRQACWPAAPPKQNSGKSAVSQSLPGCDPADRVGHGFDADLEKRLGEPLAGEPGRAGPR